MYGQVHEQVDGWVGCGCSCGCGCGCGCVLRKKKCTYLNVHCVFGVWLSRWAVPKLYPPNRNRENTSWLTTAVQTLVLLVFLPLALVAGLDKERRGEEGGGGRLLEVEKGTLVVGMYVLCDEYMRVVDKGANFMQGIHLFSPFSLSLSLSLSFGFSPLPPLPSPEYVCSCSGASLLAAMNHDASYQIQSFSIFA